MLLGNSWKWFLSLIFLLIHYLFYIYLRFCFCFLLHELPFPMELDIKARLFDLVVCAPASSKFLHSFERSVCCHSVSATIKIAREKTSCLAMVTSTANCISFVVVDRSNGQTTTFLICSKLPQSSQGER